jgi:hypothetical protein
VVCWGDRAEPSATVAFVTHQPERDHFDLNRVYMLLREMSAQQHDSDAAGPHRVAELIAAQEDPEPIMRGLGAVINELVGLVGDLQRVAARGTLGGDVEEPVPDVLYAFQPDIIVRLAKTPGIDWGAVPVMAGALTAAALRFNSYEWRSRMGSWDRSEYATWAYAAWYLCDLIGHLTGQSDFALNMIGSMLDTPPE